MSNDSFFDESLEQSRIKAEIVRKYFWAWATIIIPTAKRLSPRSPRIAYIDLFAGPGRYKNQTKSTPVLVLEEALKNHDMCQMLVTIFNDKDIRHVQSLEKAINEIPNIDRLKHRPVVQNHVVGKDIVRKFQQMRLVPTLFFVDPWGYKGLSLQLINSVLKDWGCDCIIFFNYNRINMGLSNPAVQQHMVALFGSARAEQLLQQLNGLSPEDRELTIVNELAQALRDMGGKYVLPFRFRNQSGARTSHHLIFVTKDFKGYHVMKGVMAKQSSDTNEGVATFEYNPATIRQPLLYKFTASLDDLMQSLRKDLSGQTLTMKEVYERHSIDTPFLDANYKEALRRLEAAGLITVNPPADKRRKIKGVATFAKKVEVTFP